MNCRLFLHSILPKTQTSEDQTISNPSNILSSCWENDKLSCLDILRMEKQILYTMALSPTQSW